MPAKFIVEAGKKRCCACKQILDATPENFSKDKTKKDGLNGMCKVCSREHSKAHYADNSEEILRKGKEKRRDIKRKNTKKRAWNNRHDKQALLLNDLTDAQWQDTLQEFGNCCAYCGSTQDLQKEHIVPVDSYGPTTKWNVIPACNSCNGSKANSDLLKWYMSRPFFSTERLTKIVAFMDKYKPKVEPKVVPVEA